MAYTKEDIKKRMQQREEKPSLSSSAKMTKDDVKKRLAQRELNALGSSVANADETLSKAFGGWNDAASMQNYRGTIQGASDSINDYINKYASTMDVETRSGLNKLATRYSNALNAWDDTTALYDYYKNADAYNIAKKKQDMKDKYKGKSYEKIQQALAESTDGQERDYLRNFTDYSSAEDFDKAINAIQDPSQKKNLEESKKKFETDRKFSAEKVKSDQIAQEYTDWSTQNLGTKILATPINAVGNVLLSAGAGLETALSPFSENGYNPYANLSGLLRATNASTSAITEEARDKFGILGALGYEAISAGIPSRIGQSIFGKYYNVIMGAGVFASTYADALDRGMNVGDAAYKAFAAGAIEFLTEQIGMDWAFDRMGSQTLARSLIKQAGAEGLEEVVGNIANIASDSLHDAITGRSTSDLKRTFDEYISRGFTPGEAFRSTFGDEVMDTVESAVAAALSAGAEGGVRGAMVANAGSQIDSEMLAQYAQNKGGETYDLYKDYIDNAKLSNWQKGNIYGAYVNENRQDLKAAAVARDVDKFMQAEDNATVLKSMQKTKTKTDFKTTKEGEGIKATDVVNEEGRTYAVDSEGVMHDLSEEAVTVSQAVLYENASAIEDEDVRKLYLDYEGQDVDGYTRNFDLAYEMAARGIPLKEIQESVNFNAISSEKVTAIYEKASNIKFRNSVEARKAMDIKMAKWSGEYRPGKLDTSSIDMNSLSKTEKSMVKFLELFSKMGMNIKVVSDDSEVPDGDTLGNQITINLKARYWKKSRAVEGKYAYSTFAHESTHWMSNILGAEFDTFKAVVQQTIGMRKWNDFVALEINNANYDDEGNLVPEDQRISQEIAEEEAIARICEDMLNDPKAVERILASASDSQIQRLINAVKSWFENIKKDIEELLKGYSSVSTEAQYLKGMEEQFKTIQDAWVEMFERALKANQALVEESMEALQANDTAHAEEVLGFEVKATPKNSLKLDDSLGEKSIKANNTNVDPATKEKKMNVDPRVLTNSIAQRKGIARALRALERFLPEDIEGNALTKNGSYGRSVEHALICVRSLVNNWFVDKVANEIGRPLTAEEQIVASEILAGKVGNQRECQYCYVAADRRSYKATFKKYLDDYNDLRSKAINNKEAYASELDYLTKNYSRIKDQFKVKDTREAFAKSEAKNIPGLTEYLAGRAPTVNMLDRYMHIVSDAVKGVAAIDPKRFSTETIRQLHKNDKVMGWYVKDATSYAKAATKAKLTYRDIKVKGKKMRLEYVAYNGNILNMNPDLIIHLNGEYGLRLYSDSDYVPAFLLEDMQIVTDAAVKGLKMLAYTKDMGFAKVFAPTEMNINISTYGVLDEAINNDKEFEKAKAEYLINQNDKTRKAYLDALSKYVIYDGMQGADWEETKDLRKEYKNISAIFVATNDDLVEWAMAQDWIDVVIPYHTVFAGLETKEYFKYSNYKDIQGDRKAKGWQDGDLKSIPPTIHGNDLKKYKQALKDNHLTARFAKWENNPNYMKLVNETRLPYTESQPVQPKFDWDAAEAEIARIAVEGKYGFGQGMNSEEDQERLFGEDAKKAVKLIASGKISRQDVDDFLSGKTKYSKKVDSDGNALTVNQEKFFERSKARDKDGNLLVMYHGTANSGAFNIFEGSKLSNSTESSQIGQGFYFTNVKEEAESYMKNVDVFTGKLSQGSNPYMFKTYLNIENPFDVNKDTLNTEDVKKVFNDGDYQYFFDSYIPFYLNNKTVNGKKYTRAEVSAMSKEEKVDLYVDYYSSFGQRELLREMVRAFKFDEQDKLLESMKNRLGYDGFVDEFSTGKYQYVALSSNQIKSVTNENPTENPDIRYARKVSEVEEKAIQTFGTTTDFAEAGYILSNGQMLKFTTSDKPGDREYDHRAIAIAYGKDIDLKKNHGFDMNATPYLERFVEEGAIRLDAGSLDLNMDMGIQLSSKVPLTPEQEQTVRELVEWKMQREEMYNPDDDPSGWSLYSGPLRLMVEFGGSADYAVGGVTQRDLDAWHVPSIEYAGAKISPYKVIADIRHYYETGEINKPSELAQFRYSKKVTDKKTLDFLNKQIEDGDYITTYKSMRLDGYDKNGMPILHSPMAALINGKYENEYKIGEWYQAVEHPESAFVKIIVPIKERKEFAKKHPELWKDLVKTSGQDTFFYAEQHPELIQYNKNGEETNLYFNLDKGKNAEGKSNGDLDARYNPYEHSSNSVFNDQFKGAYERPELVTVEMRVPKSEATSGYKAKFAKDPVGWTEWKSGDVSRTLAKYGKRRDVFLSRYAMAVRVLDDAEVAQKYKETLDGTGIKVPDNVVTPNLLNELMKAGVEIEKTGKVKYARRVYDDYKSIADGNSDFLYNTNMFAGKEGGIKESQIIKSRDNKQMSSSRYIRLRKGQALYIVDKGVVFANESRNPVFKLCYDINVEVLESDNEYQNITSWYDDAKSAIVQFEKKKENTEYERKQFCDFVSQSLRMRYGREVVISLYIRQTNGQIRRYDYTRSGEKIRPNLSKVGFDSYREGILHNDRRNLHSKKVNDPDIFGQNKRLEAENEKLKADVERLKNRLKIEKVYTKGKMLDDHKIDVAARVILKEARSTYDEKKLAEGLKDVYQYIVDNSNKEILWDEIMNKAAVVARKVLDASKPEKITDDYFKGILREIRAAKIKLTDEQIQEVKSWYGDDWRRDFLGKIMLTKEGRSLDSYWSEWSSMHPDVFDPNLNPNDQVTAILDIYDEMKELSTEYVKYNDNESVRALAIEIYNKFWNVPTVTTLTDKHKAEINKLKADHKQAIKELKDSNTSELAKMKQDQKLADDIYYGKKISKEKEFYQNAIKKVRADKDRRFNQYKEYKKDQQAKMRDAIARKKLVDKIMVTSKTLFKWIDENSKDHHIPKAMLPVVKQLLGSIDFSSKQLLGLRGGSKAGMPTKSDVSFREAMDRLRNLIIQSSTEEGMAELGGYIDFPADYQARINTLCDEINKTAAKIGADNIYIINEMNVDDLTDLYDIVKTIKHLVQTMNVTIAGANKVKISDTARNTINYSNKLGDKKNRSKLNAMFEFSNSLPIYTFERMGEGAMRMFEGVQDGWDKFAFNIKKVINDAKGMFNSQQEKDWTEHSQEVTLMILPTEQEMKEGAEPHEEKIRITDAQIMSLYCLSKRDHAIQHMYNGGICIAEFDDKTHKVVQSRNYRLNAAEVNKLIGLLSKEQIEVADKIQNYMNTVCKDWGNEVSMKRYGIEGFKEENYFPIKVDQNGLPVNAQDREKSVYALLNMGFTKPINPRAKNPIEIGNIFDVFTIHASEMAKYNSIALPVLDMVKWFSFTEKQGTDIVGTRKSLLQAFGKDANTYIRHFLNDLNGMQESGRGEGVMKKLTRSYKTAAVAANMQVMALQPISILRATAVMDEKYILKGMANVGKIKYGMEMCQKYSGIAVWKSLSLFDTNVSRGIDAQIRQNANLKDKAIELSMKGAEMADEITWGAIWNACEYETRAKNKGLEGEALYQATAKRFRDVVYRTQVVDSTMTRTDVMRSSNLAAQWATSFMSEPSVTMNLFQNMIYKYLQDRREVGYKEAVRRNKRNILKVGEAFLLTSIVEAALRGAFSKVRHPEDDEEYLELLWSEFKQNMNLANNIPIVKDVINEIQGYDVRRPDVESVRNAIKAINGFAKNGMTYKNLYRAAQSVSQLTGIPISSAMREFVAMLELLTDIEVDK